MRVSALNQRFDTWWSCSCYTNSKSTVMYYYLENSLLHFYLLYWMWLNLLLCFNCTREKLFLYFYGLSHFSSILRDFIFLSTFLNLVHSKTLKGAVSINLLCLCLSHNVMSRLESEGFWGQLEGQTLVITEELSNRVENDLTEWCKPSPHNLFFFPPGKKKKGPFQLHPLVEDIGPFLHREWESFLVRLRWRVHTRRVCKWKLRYLESTKSVNCSLRGKRSTAAWPSNPSWSGCVRTLMTLCFCFLTQARVCLFLLSFICFSSTDRPPGAKRNHVRVQRTRVRLELGTQRTVCGCVRDGDKWAYLLVYIGECVHL